MKLTKVYITVLIGKVKSSDVPESTVASSCNVHQVDASYVHQILSHCKLRAHCRGGLSFNVYVPKLKIG